MDDPVNRIEMKVDGLVFDPLTNTPIIILKDLEGERSLPIWVGYPEATAIALEMESVSTPRPMTHDLIRNLLVSINATISHITVNDLKNNTFYAMISLMVNGDSFEVDSRPSDAIAVALRVDCPIYVLGSVIENAKALQTNKAETSSEEEKDFKNWLDNIKPSDFGNIDQ